MNVSIVKDAVSLWDKFGETADFASNEYDKQLLRTIKLKLGFPVGCDVCMELAARKTTVEELLAALLKALEPFSVMLRDLLNMFMVAGAQYGDNNIEIRFDFGSAKESFDLDLEHFRIYEEQTVKVLNKAYQIEQCYPWKAFVNPIEKSLELVGERLSCNMPELPPRIQKWLQMYDDRENNWPTNFPLSPQSGCDRIDKLISDLWQLPKIANALYRKCYSANLGRWGSLRAMEDKVRTGFYQAESDLWIKRFIKILCSVVYDVRKLCERKNDCGPEIDAIGDKLEKFKEGLPVINTESELTVKKLLDLLNLPVWEKRYALYSAWVATQIVSASDQWKVNYSVKDKTLSFSFKGSEIARIQYMLHEFVLHAELRTPYADVKGHGRTHSIQPDYSICWNNPSEPKNTVLVVECKQYKRASKKNFVDAVKDYAGGRPNAKVILVNYKKVPKTFRKALPPEINEKVPYFDILSPDGEGCDLFKEAVRNALSVDTVDQFWKDCCVRLTWSESPTDLDLILVITKPDGSKTKVMHSSMGASDRPPYAWLDEDVRTAYGSESIHAVIDTELKYDFYVNNYSGESPKGRILAVLSFGREKRIELPMSEETDLSKKNLWHVFSIDCLSVLTIDQTTQDFLHRDFV